jgi:CheY-like chemotaxis protein
MAKVLLVGYIVELLQERGLVLSDAGYEVTMASSFAIATDAIEQGLFHVAVLGFSIPEDERNRLARAIKQANPATRIIMVYFASIKNTELADALLQTTAGAEGLLRAIHHILTAQNRARTG